MSNIGPAIKIIEVEPLESPVPPEPTPETEPQPEPQREPEPVGV